MASISSDDLYLPIGEFDLHLAAYTLQGKRRAGDAGEGNKARARVAVDSRYRPESMGKLRHHRAGFHYGCAPYLCLRHRHI